MCEIPEDINDNLMNEAVSPIDPSSALVYDIYDSENGDVNFFEKLKILLVNDEPFQL